jgi:multidrug efflux pump subunit AcrA (membrane-fusion protein)
LQANQSIVSILQNDPLTAVVHVVEKDYPKVHVGQQAIVSTDAYPDKTFTGGIVRIAPLLKETSRQARVEIEIANADHLLKPGMFIRAQIEFARHDNATLVPLAALVKRNGKQGVFVAKAAQDNDAQSPRNEPNNVKASPPSARRASFVPVTVGIISGEVVEVLEPQILGSVVTIGNHLLEDGSEITVADKERSKEAAQKQRSESEPVSVGTKPGGAQ